MNLTFSSFKTISEEIPDVGREILWIEVDDLESINVQIGEADDFGEDGAPDVRVNGMSLIGKGVWMYTSDIRMVLEDSDFIDTRNTEEGISDRRVDGRNLNADSWKHDEEIKMVLGAIGSQIDGQSLLGAELESGLARLKEVMNVLEEM